MKKLIVLIVNLFFLSLMAQRPEIPRELTNLLDVPYLQNGGFSGEETPGGIIRFDKFVVISTATSKGELAEIFLYINTTTGAIATITDRKGMMEDENFDTESKDFLLTYISPKGKFIQFYNRLKKGVLEKRFSTLNTEVVALTPSLPMSNTWVFKQSSEIRTLPQNFRAVQYKATTANAPTLTFCGYPPAEKLLISNFIGYSGIGYVKTDKAIYMVTEMKPASGGNSFVAQKWKEVNLSLNLADFSSAEAEFYSTAGNDIEKKLNKPPKNYTGECASLEFERDIEKKRILMEQKDLLAKSGRGNMINDKSVQNAMAVMQDPTRNLIMTRLETEISLCKMIDRRNRQNITDLDKRKIRCLETKLGDIAETKAESDAIDARFGADKAKALPEKQKIWSKLSKKTSPECMKVL